MRYQRIKDLREDGDLSQAELSSRLDMYKTTYVNYEQGKRAVPLDFALKLADYFDVSLDYIAGRTNLPKGNDKNALSFDEIKLIENFHKLNERDKGKVEQLITDLLYMASEKSDKIKQL